MWYNLDNLLNLFIMKLTPKEKIAHTNEYEIVLKYNLEDIELKEFSSFHLKEDINLRIIELSVLESIYMNQRVPADHFFCYYIKTHLKHNYFSWFEKISNTIDLYHTRQISLSFHCYEIFYYNSQGEKFKIEVSDIEDIIKEIKKINKKHKLSGIMGWHNSTIEKHVSYNNDIEKFIQNSLVMNE